MKTLWTIDGIGTPDKNSRLHSLVGFSPDAIVDSDPVLLFMRNFD